MKLPAIIERPYRIVMEVTTIWSNANSSAMGAAVAYYTIFAIAPLFILTLALAGLCFGHEAAQRELFEQVSGLIGKKSADALQSVLAAANQPKTGTFATIIGLATLFIGATSVFIQLQQSLNAIWNVRPKRGTLWQFIRTRLISFGTLLGIGFLLLVSLVLSAALAAAGKWLRGVLPAEAVIWQGVDFIISLALITALFAMMFKILPDVKIDWRDVWIGALITALLFTCGKVLIGLYLGRSSVSSAYGAAGSLILVLVWVYYSVQIVLFGAASTRVWAQRHNAQIHPLEGAEFFLSKCRLKRHRWQRPIARPAAKSETPSHDAALRQALIEVPSGADERDV
ncbi:MAG TPA: YihY/virulence factor BrkB family protein [Verrucomicrobiae bacterium]